MDNTIITVADLMVIRAAIDIAAKRGAYHAVDMSAIGTVFDKLNAFLTAIEEQQAESEESDSDQE